MDDADDYKLRRSFLVPQMNRLAKARESAGKLRLRLMNTKVLTSHFGFTFERHNFLHYSFDEKIKQLKPSGIVEAFYLFDSRIRKRYAKEVESPEHLVVLTLDHLFIGFLVWIFMLFIAFAVFSYQYYVYWNPKVWKLIWLRCALSYYYSSIIDH